MSPRDDIVDILHRYRRQEIKTADEAAELIAAVIAPTWNAAIDAAANVADEWTHYGDPAEAMYASPRIRDRIKKLKSAEGPTP